MRIQANCESCFNDFRVDEKYAGKRVKCPECGAAVRISDGDESGSARKPSKKSKARKQESNQNGLLIGGGIVALVAVVGVIGFFAMNARPTNRVAAPEQPIQTPGSPQIASAHTSQNSTATPGMSHASQMPIAASAAVGTPSLGATSTPAAPVLEGSMPAALTTTSVATAGKPLDNGVSPAVSVKKREKMELVDLIALVEPSVVRIKLTSARGTSIGSGFVVDTKGTVVTNVHVMAGAKEAEAEFSNGTKARVIGFYSIDQKKDIAIVKIDAPAEKLIPLPLATVLPQKGLSVIAFGSPHGLSFTTSEGIVSALRPADEMKVTFGVEFEGDWVQTSTPISPGNSGGPLVNYYGEVVAMNTMQLTVGQNLNFAMSAMDISDAVSKAPTDLKPITADAIQTLPTSRSRAMASDETETERGARLLSEINEIFLLNGTNEKTLVLDATGAIWNKIIVKSRSAVEKSNIQLSVGVPSDDAAIMFVILELKTSKKKTTLSGTQELHIKAELICKDDKAKADESKICRIWKGEENLGTVSINSLMNGVFPPQAEEKLSGFFLKFRGAFSKARRSVKKSDG